MKWLQQAVRANPWRSLTPPSLSVSICEMGMTLTQRLLGATGSTESASYRFALTFISRYYPEGSPRRVERAQKGSRGSSGRGARAKGWKIGKMQPCILGSLGLREEGRRGACTGLQFYQLWCLGSCSQQDPFPDSPDLSHSSESRPLLGR